LPPHKLALRLCDESQITVKCALLPVSRGFTARRTGSGLRFLVQQLDECVVALFKFGRFDRLHGRDARSKSKFSVAVAAVVVAAVAAVTVAKVSVTASTACRRATCLAAVKEFGPPTAIQGILVAPSFDAIWQP
jgi:hypothetical protein